jgi:hypothetical protein
VVPASWPHPANLHDGPTYDAVWLPLPFLPHSIVGPAAAVSARALRPGGWLLLGTYAGPPDQLAWLLVDLRTVRSGGHVWGVEELTSSLESSGLVEVHEVERRWGAPVRLFAARRLAVRAGGRRGADGRGGVADVCS